MNTDFPRIITLLRKERNISQKQAAADLGVSQALLSHYEKGIRECGLDFLVKTADYYNVSCDYLLGRSAEPNGRADIPAPVHENGGGEQPLSGMQKIVSDSERLVFSMLKRLGDSALERAVCEYLSLAVYRIFRVLYSANPKNDRRFFTVSSAAADSFALSAMEIKKARAEQLCAEGKMQDISITTNSISLDYPEYASSLLNGIKQCEGTVSVLTSAENGVQGGGG